MYSVAMDNSSSYSEMLALVKMKLTQRQTYEKNLETLRRQHIEGLEELVVMNDSLTLLSAVSDDNTKKTLDFITGMVNKVLSEIFPVDTPSISLKKSLYGGTRPHIDVELINGNGNVMNMELQSGAGLSQVVSFMYAVCLIEVRKDRRMLILDERLNGLHKEAKRIIEEIIKIFSSSGFQFIFVEYGLNKLGKIYNIEKRGDASRVVPLDGKDYDENAVYVGDVDLSLLDNSEFEV